MSRQEQIINDLREYGQRLAAAGLEVWLNTHYWGGWLTYKNPENGCYGTFQHSDHFGWSHYMPLIPSREYGSAMFVGNADDWSVEAALRTAMPENFNPIVGTQKNAKSAYSPVSAAEQIFAPDEAQA